MARALFNGTCSLCDVFRPRCARVLYVHADGICTDKVMCDVCRKRWQGHFTLDPKHKRPKTRKA